MGKMLGGWGDVGCFSFFSNKNLSTGEGGMIVTHREDIAEKITPAALAWDDQPDLGPPPGSCLQL